MNDEVHPKPFEIYSIYHATYLHFTTDYDFQKYNGKTNYTEKKFEHRKDKYSFHKLAKQFGNLPRFSYFIAWVFFTNNKVYPKTIADHIPAWEEWCAWHNQRIYSFEQDIKTIKEAAEAAQPFEMVLRNEIHWGTFLILDRFMDLVGMLDETHAGNYLWEKASQKIKKFRPFYYEFEPISEIFYKGLIKECLLKA